MADIDFNAIRLFAPPVPALARPVRIGRMRDARWRGEVGFAPLLVGRHAGSDLVQFLERMDPEEFIEIEIAVATLRSEEHTSELQSLMRISYAVFCLQKKTKLY